MTDPICYLSYLCVDDMVNIGPDLLEFLNPFPNKPWFLQYRSLENNVGKEEIARNEAFGKLSFIFIKLQIVICKLFQLEESKICRLGKG